MLFLPVNLWAVLASLVASIVIGFVWYSPILFGKQWMALSKIDPKKMNPAKSYALSAISTLVMVYILAHVLSLTLVTTTTEGAIMGALIWLGFVATTALNLVIFEKRPWALFFINSGYCLASLVVSGIILTMWV